MEKNILEKIRIVLQQAEEIANLAGEKYRTKTFEKTYEFLLSLLKSGYIPTVVEERELLIERLSLPELISKANPKSNPERMVVIAYYITVIEGKKEFTFEDIMDEWKKAALRKPGNPRRDFKVTIRKGWISSTDDTYYLTLSGREYVESLLKSKKEE